MSNWATSAPRASRQVGFTLGTYARTLFDIPDSATPGAWVEVTPAAPFAAGGVRVGMDSAVIEEYNNITYVSVGIGPAGSERVIADSLRIGLGPFTTTWELPVLVPRGVRVAIRGQRNGGAMTQAAAVVDLIPLDWNRPAPPTRWTGHRDGQPWWNGIGGSTGTGGSYGSWQQAVASSPHSVTHVGVMMENPGDSGTKRVMAVQVGIGPAASERIVVDCGQTIGANWGPSHRNLLVYPVPLIPAGTRFAVRGSSNGAAIGVMSMLYLGG